MCARGRLSPAKLTRHSETDLASGSRPGWPGSPIAVLAGRLGCRSDWLAPPPFFLLTPRPRSLVPLSYPHNAGGSVPGTERTYDVGSARPENDARSQTPTHALWRRESGHGNPLGISWHRKRPTRAACTDFSPLFTCVFEQVKRGEKSVQAARVGLFRCQEIPKGFPWPDSRLQSACVGVCDRASFSGRADPTS